MDLKKIGYEDVNWSQLTQDMVLVVCCCKFEPSGTMNAESIISMLVRIAKELYPLKSNLDFCSLQSRNHATVKQKSF
jgi:hypothetical protein